MPLLPDAEPYAHDGNKIGIIVSHGFTGQPKSVKPWAKHLAAAGFTVRAPRLPGHGTRWQEMNNTVWQDWYAEIERTYRELADKCDQIFVMGLSMGGSLALRLAEEKGKGIAGIYPFDIADTKIAQVKALAERNEFPLLCTLEPE